ncbi:protein phosphatase 2C domain-containing protein [Streptomyces sp. NBC_01551]|uniref:protein phosphatase 2C domain-containing protein n=1 Tax=Streptomyces sp. NBC_01551 TaxID=2975876 RepID=UPI002250AC6E|nr:protein phosphatase 2C domain-containing protein [Streptomyces sp. NBC_01551]MCX4525913.1 protein phosphatase 2C domain-containing protein [Streptomyces sp. NBC_01551]
MSMHRLSGCPSCAEPLEEGDRFCGVCGYALSSPPPSQDHPTLPLPAPAGRGPAGEAAGGRGRATATSDHPGPQARAAEAPGGRGYAGTGTDTDEAPASAGGSWGPGANAAVPAGRHRGADARAGEAAGSVDGYPLAGPDAYSGAGAAIGGPGYAGSGGEHHAPAERAGVRLDGGREHGDDCGYGAVPAPGWGSTDEAAPTLVGDAAGWSAAASVSDPGDTAPRPSGETAPEGTGETRYDPPGDGGKTCVACRAGRVDTDGYCEHCGHAQPRERDHLEEELGSVAAVSDRGLRHHRNEDSFAVAATALPDGSAATVAIVCDGVSSASRPDEASAAAAAAANEALLEALPRGTHPQKAMHEAILAAAAAVNALAPDVPGAQNAPACTLVGAVVSGGLLTIGWVGDSRAYWVPDDRAALPRRLTEDDSWAAQMVAAGLMGEAEAYADVRAHAITGWLGADAYDLEPHTASFKPDHDGVVVVCTDGLWNYAESAHDMAQVLPEDAAARPLHSAQVLVGHALDGGGHDNVTVALVPFNAPPDADPAAAAQPQAEPQAEADPRTQA